MPNSLTDPYASVTDYHAAITKSDTSHDTDILADLNAISRYIDGQTGRFFGKDTADKDRIYPGPSRRRLWTDDFVSVTTVKIDEGVDGTFATTLAATDYQLWPLNAALGPEVNPYTGIQMVYWGSRFIFPSSAQVKVTGVFGWPAVPDPIKRACIQLTAILRLESPRANREMMAMNLVLGTSPAAQSIVDNLINSYSRMAFA